MNAKNVGFYVFFSFCISMFLVNPPIISCAEIFDPLTFVQGSEGPWSDIQATTVTAYKVPNGSIKVDGTVTAAEYGKAKEVYLSPDETGYPNNWPDDFSWDNTADSSCTFWVAHDDTFFYIGVDAKDDIVNANDPPPNTWNDDAVEIIIDGDNFDFDLNSGDGMNTVDPPIQDKTKVNLRGGQIVINYRGEPSLADNDPTFAAATGWSFGANKEVYAVGQQVKGGWQLEIRFAKKLFESSELGTKLQDDYKMGFNLGIDDDDLRGPGGSQERSQDLEIQYYWSARKRAVDPTGTQVWNEETMNNLGYTPKDVWNGKYREVFTDWSTIAPGHGGYLRFGSAGDVVFSNKGTAVGVTEWAIY